jgi:hypothetical protein
VVATSRRLLERNEGIGLRFDQLLFGFFQIGFGLNEIVLLPTRIELRDDITLFDQITRVPEEGNRQLGGSSPWHDQSARSATLELTARGDFDIHVGATNGRRRHSAIVDIC